VGGQSALAKLQRDQNGSTQETRQGGQENEAARWQEEQEIKSRQGREQVKKIGIIGAMEVEVETLKKDMEVGRVVKKAGMEFHEGVLNGMPVVVVRSGICKVNAAVCTQILIDDFGVDGIINTGVGGSLNAEINIGDIVISTDVVHHDVNAVEFGYALGQIPQMKVFSFPADEAFAEKAKAACNRVNPDITVWRGRICSGDQFVSSQEQKDQIIKAFHGWCTEMEGAGIAQTAYLNGVPFIIVRAISDKADNSAYVDYATFEKKAAEHSVRLVEALMSDLAQ
jgi:adenosylhomocysteine nucleosidase